MPAPRNTYDKTHLKDISSYLRKIDDIFREAAGEAAAIGASVRGGYDPGKPFSFDDYPKTKKRVESLLKGLERGIETVVTDGVTEQWGLSNAKNDEAARKALGKAADNLTREQRERYFSDHAAALKAFRERKVDGLGLSDRVWRYTDQFREEIEMGIDTGLSEGRSADQMSRDLRGYLRNPDKLFRRVRDARGNLVLSGNAKAYHPGAGVYRSSYRNARRLAATETNMAYRTADHERWRDMDFVVGIEIQTSNNHTLDGKPLEDICDTLAGRYPKEFKFTGWHPQCRCFATTILKTEEEMKADNGRISAGGEPSSPETSSNYIGELPKNFTRWMDANADRIEDAKSLPYFLKDNEGLIGNGGATTTKDDEFNLKRDQSDMDMKFTGVQLRNFEELEKKLNIRRGLPMSFRQADKRRSNPYYDINGARTAGYKTNCQTCTVSYYLRRMGFNVEAMPSTAISKLIKNGFNWQSRFLNADGTPTTYKWSFDKYKSSTIANSTKIQFIDDYTKDAGIYEIYVGWKSGFSHVIILERDEKGRMFLFDPQSGDTKDVIDWNCVKGRMIGVLRIDDKIVNTGIASIFRGKHIKV